MTREDAIERNLFLLENMKINHRLHPDAPFDYYNFVALKMAIKALRQEPCEDAISRQAVLKTLDDMDNVLDDDRTIENYKELLKECYEVLTPVNPQESILDKIRAEIDRQEKWLLQAGYTVDNIVIAFNAIKSVVAESEK